ncbi:MAG: nucleoside 2-deoxyribosyltransferase domain-containing protein [Nanoarchaeota archaeon]|nr:nucleoside 2-deoxyribosyltransferase domain-containing protein [Nanoarchaeota archaeon]
MKYIECPEVYNKKGNEKSLFIAGGITECGNWQNDFIDSLKNENLIVLNPRRKNFDINDEEISIAQIKWEYEHLKKASAISFWFTSETLCPITLYELGKVQASRKPVFLGVHPAYKRKFDLEVQTGLIRPETKIVYSLNDLSKQVIE